MRPLPFVALLLAPSAASQTLSIVVSEDDVIPGVGEISRIDGVSIASDGTAFIEVDTDNPDTAADSVLLRNGVLFLREDQALPLPPGARLGSFDGISAGPGGTVAMNLFLDGTTGTSDNSGIYFGDTLVLQEGTASNAAAFAPGTDYIGFFDAQFGAPDEILVVASVDDPTITSSVDRALVVLTIDGAGNLLGESVVALEGEILPGQTEPIADFETGAEESDINASGQVIYGVDLAGDTATDRALYLDGTLLAQEGSPSPIPGRNWGSLTSVEVDLNDAGDYVFRSDVDGDTADDDVIVRNGAVFRRAGETLPDIAPFVLEDFGSSIGVWLTASGDVIWFGEWSDPDSTRDEGIFFNDRLVLQKGVTTIGGSLVVDITDITEQVHVAPDGSRMLVECEIDGPGGEIDVVVEIAFGLGTNCCDANANSTGVTARIAVAGSDVAADNDLTLSASSLPTFSFGFFLTSLDQGFVMNPGGSAGNLCLGGSIGRYVGPGQIQNSGAGGAFSLDVNLTQHPTPTGFVIVTAGDTWNFQAWYRDSVGGAPTSNFTDGIELSFR
ncbi:MAG: hypothetical protein AAF726_22365 [Planctomycetota bacterium]